jgi:hypothetical protein
MTEYTACVLSAYDIFICLLGGTYSNSGYNQGPREQRSGSGRGGFQRGRGGNRGNMSNGYSRGGRGNSIHTVTLIDISCF